MNEPVLGVVLAAGSSTRMGKPKQLLPYRGTTILETVVRAAEASQLEEVVVVVAPGFDTDTVALGRAEWAVN
ncbi:MAG: NTP transferase domain-containing protein, partial [Acidimicrobiia bacterium]|nr:NTP transferase domain-containing protein [Acidimicrobiia bacterium]